ncbi:ROK family protein [Streptosporangium roseum]|uniref:Glucose kinase n=1 Tax=Streptosporangium roseum (strain ATCC 12428 / DSM 43021 / JCM 3005 / KCTC 9067 / NCIMB 10171 / NRRL 2505 / NI 9100) TaxID=479432 RepID=D2B2H3_STRRD|nr:ROK family protein [Streptosporangium roseum]ACZ91199.1 glucose kinase [Streptosporangium roseum DSM 43021]
MSGLVLAVDIGGTKFAVALVDSDGNVRTARRAATPPGGDARTLWKALGELVDSLLDGAAADGLINGDAAAGGAVAGVGIGCGGPMTWPEGAVSPLNMPGWRGFPLRARLAERFPGVPVRIHNDAVCLAVAEHWRGAGRGSANMLGMVVSTGVGGGLILGDRLIDGGSGNAGHIGHIVVDPGGPPCGCGGRGCLEAVARGPGLAAWAVEQGWNPGAAGPPAAATAPPGEGPRTSGGTAATSGGGNGALNGEPGDPGAGSAYAGSGYVEAAVASGRQLALDAEAGDEIALAAMSRAGRALGLAIASATNLCDLDVVTIGGGLSQAGPLLFDPLEATLRDHTRMEFARRVRVVPASLGQDAGLVGAAALILATDRYWTH